MIHFYNEYFHDGNSEARIMDRAEYVGFAIGAESMHPAARVELNGRSYLVKIGAPVILPRTSDNVGSPRLTPLRRLNLQVNAAGNPYERYTSPIHVLGYECTSELVVPVAQSLAPWVHSFAWGTGEGSPTSGTVLTLPAWGRSQIQIGVVSGELVKVNAHLLGQDPDTFDLIDDPSDPPTRTAEFLADVGAGVSEKEIYSGTANDIIVVADIEAVDLVELTLGDGTPLSATVEVRML